MACIQVISRGHLQYHLIIYELYIIILSVDIRVLKISVFSDRIYRYCFLRKIKETDNTFIKLCYSGTFISAYLFVHD